MAKYFRLPFGIDGNRATIPDAAPVDGSINYDTGYPIDYQLDPSTNPAALNIARDTFNELMYQTQLALQYLQQVGFPAFITTSDNGGTPFPYLKNATVRWTDGQNYYALADNSVTPADNTKWAPVVYAIGELTGVSKKYWGSTLPAGGYVWENGQTIGNTGSGANFADPSALALFTLLWTSIANAALPIQDSSGAATTRGSSAAADWAALKRLPTPDSRGRVPAGNDAMGGTTPAGRLTTAGSGIAGAQLGVFGGFETNTLDITQMPPHTHSTTRPSRYGENGVAAQPDFGSGDVSAGNATQVTGSAGGSGSPTPATQPHANVQPTIICNWIIKL